MRILLRCLRPGLPPRQCTQYLTIPTYQYPRGFLYISWLWFSTWYYVLEGKRDDSGSRGLQREKSKEYIYNNKLRNRDRNAYILDRAPWCVAISLIHLHPRRIRWITCVVPSRYSQLLVSIKRLREFSDRESAPLQPWLPPLPASPAPGTSSRCPSKTPSEVDEIVLQSLDSARETEIHPGPHHG